MLKRQFSSKQVNKLSTDIKKHLTPVTIDRGLDYYKNNRVKWLAVKNSAVISTVRGNALYTVIIDLLNFPNSNCSCPVGKFCKHTAAVFFYIYSHFHEPETFFTDNKPNEKPVPVTPPVTEPARTDDKASSIKKKASQTRKKSIAAMPTPEGPVEDWYNHYEKTFNQANEEGRQFLNRWNSYFNYYLLNQMFTNYRKGIFPLSNNWPEDEQKLHRFLGIIFFMTKAEEMVDKTHYTYLDRNNDVYFENPLFENIPKLNTPEQQEKHQAVLEKAMHVFRHCLLLKKHDTLFDWLTYYRIVWSSFLYHPDWAGKESKTLEQILPKTKPDTRQYYHTVLGLVHFKVLAQQDTNAWELLDKTNSLAIGDLYFYLSLFKEYEQWDRLLEWLRRLSPRLERGKILDLESISEYWTELADHIDVHKEFSLFLQKRLPESRYIYADYLLERKEYRDWVELLICLGRDFAGGNPIIEIFPKEISVIKAQEPQTLLPLYHQWVIRIIEEKNRKAYQEAVRLLKKLRALYNKLKMSREWKEFISQLAARYPRSRALHEELRKGKLIS